MYNKSKVITCFIITSSQSWIQVPAKNNIVILEIIDTTKYIAISGIIIVPEINKT